MVETTDEQQGGTPPAGPNADQEWLQTYMGQHEGAIEPGTRVQTPKEKAQGRLLVLVLLMLAAAGAMIFLTKNKGLQLQANAKANDLGQGVSTDSGLRGHLVAEWKDKTVHYKLKIEPIDNLAAPGFVRAVETITQPVYMNVRVLDKAGQPLCGKQIVLTPGAASNGVDTFKQVSSDGQVDGLWSEGTMPCSPDQYARFDYWDFTTNFPTVAEQAKMLGVPLPEREEETPAPQTQSPSTTGQPSQAEHRTARHRHVTPKKPQSAFYLEGDDRVTAFEPGRNVLTVGPGKSFTLVRAGDVSTASAWADDSSLVHYTCDQRANCTLRHGGTLLPARMNY
ncbi:MAG TPA: hypothetical protein VG893_13710 [Terracidiphilus sp.]|nr:hypothetical protein [Terracidiphilus sp.]